MAAECKLNEASICHLGNCIKKVTGLPSNSTSPSDTWLLEFKPGTIYVDVTGKSIEIPHAFCKIFINPSSLEQWLAKSRATPDMYALWSSRYLSLQGLEYELQFSEFVQNTILNGKKSPHFIRTFSVGRSCKFTDLNQTLQKGGISYAHANLARNMYYSLQLAHTRPSISDPTFPSWPKNWNNFQFSFLLTQQIDVKQSKTFTDWVWTTKTNPEFLGTLFILLFQICQACYSLYSERACHNDLHSGNIWITTRPDSKKNLKYSINSKTYIFPEVTVLARLFDFDRAYAESIGRNPSLDTSLCPKNGQCNKVIESKDFVKLLCYVVKLLKGNSLQQQIVRGIIIEEGKLTESLTLFNRLEEMSCHPADEVFNEAAFKEFPPYPVMLDNIYNLWQRYSGKNIPDDIHVDESFVLSPLYEIGTPDSLFVDYHLGSDRTPPAQVRSAPELDASSMPRLSPVKTVPL